MSSRNAEGASQLAAIPDARQSKSRCTVRVGETSPLILPDSRDTVESRGRQIFAAGRPAHTANRATVSLSSGSAQKQKKPPE